MLKSSDRTQFCRVIALCDDEVKEHFEAASQAAARQYATREHGEYGYVLQTLIDGQWYELDFQPSAQR